MALPVCSVCGQNESVVTMTDFQDGTTITPCPLCFPELVEYVASMADAYSALFKVMQDAEAGEVDDIAVERDDDVPTEPPPPIEPDPPKANGRSQGKSSKVPTDTAEVLDVTTDEPVTSSAE